MKLRRREFIAVAGVGGAALLVKRYITGGIKSISPPTSSVETKEITPNDEFYLTHYDRVPEIDAESWRLEVVGEVEEELTLTLDDVKAFPSKADFNTLICIGNGIGGDLIGNAKWKGIRLKDVLETAVLKPSARDLVLHGADGYVDSFPIEKAIHEATRLVYEMNNERLPLAHGFPLRAVVPGLYGIKNLKWITRIEVSAEDVRGYWQKRGWSEDGVIKVMSRIDSPRDGDIISGDRARITGIAFAGEFPISRVEVSTDGGSNWLEASLKRSLSRYSWSLWSFDWEIQGAGEFEIVARATDESGRVQEEGSVVSRRAFPDGADGFHRISVKTLSL
jgi:DMSO/TMAO reductase YedYZ molybdopterin-dependent catalytic subunit